VTPDDTHELARKIVRRDIVSLGRRVIDAHRTVWPRDVDCHYLIIQHKGHAKIRFMPPDVKESGWKD
jgi:hypothetical protein